MPDDDEDAFNTYLNWLHRGILPLDWDEEDGDDIWVPIVLTYSLGDALLDVSFKDAITDAVSVMLKTIRSDGHSWMPDEEGLSLAHDKLPWDSKLNLLFAHSYARLPNASDLINETQPAGLLFNMTQELIRPFEETKDAVARCVFHEHAPGAENCYRSKRA